MVQESRKHPLGAYAVVAIGAVIFFNIAAFGWPDFGWKTAKGVKTSNEVAVVASHVPWCVETALRDPDVSKLAELAGIKSDYSRTTFVNNSKWATLGGAGSSNRSLAELCAEKLKKVAKVETG